MYLSLFQWKLSMCYTIKMIQHFLQRFKINKENNWLKYLCLISETLFASSIEPFKQNKHVPFWTAILLGTNVKFIGNLPES